MNNMNNVKAVVLLSGGLDSTTLLYYAVKEHGNDNIFALTTNYGQRHSIEIEKAKISCKKLGVKHKILDISFLSEIVKNVSALSNSGDVKMPDINEILGDPQPPTYVPFRNLILHSIALSFAESNSCEVVYLGIQVHDLYSYWDTTPEFVEAVNKVAQLNRHHYIVMKAPFVSLEKAEEIKFGLKLGVPYEDTWTCYTGPNEKGEACGTCPSCAERKGAFKKLGIVDPIPYKN
jgi:7-cyano-7-deazaguanine synthase